MLNRKLLMLVGAGVVVFLIIVGAGVYHQNEPREKWVFVIDDLDLKLYVDDKSIKAHEGVVEFRMLMEQKYNNLQYSHSIASVKMKLGDGKRFYADQGEVYSKDGRVSTPKINQWVPITRYSSMESIYKYVSQKVRD